MNTLLVGEQDTVGRYLVDKLYKEEDNIFWITESSDAKLWDEPIEGHVYRTDIVYRNCKEIFMANNIDTVIFMTGNHRSYRDDSDYTSIIPSLMSILKLSKNYNVKKVVLLSSMELSGADNNHPILADLKAAEILCDSWREKYDIPLLIIRMSSVYGTYYYDHMDYTGYVYSHMLENKDIYTEFSKRDKIDLLYAADAAEAVYRLISKNAFGKYDLCNGNTISVERFFDELSLISGYRKKIKYNPSIDDKTIEYNSQKISAETGWIPFYNFEDNISKVLRESNKFNNKVLKQKKEDEKKNEDKFKETKEYLRVVIENIILFIISCILIKFTQKYTDFRFIDVRLLYVVVTASIFGMRFGMISAVLSCISYGYSIIDSGIDLSYLLYSIDTWTPFAIYLIAGSSVGYIIDVKNDELENNKKEISMVNNKYKMLKDIYKEVCEIKDNLQRQILISRNSFYHVYEIISGFNTLKPELIFFKAISVLEETMETDAASIYIINSNNSGYARLIANSASLAGKLKGSIKIDDFPLIKDCIEHKTLFVNKGLLKGYPTYAAPIADGDKVIAIAMTYYTGFEKYTMYYQNLFRIVIQMIQSNLIKAYEYSRASYDNSYIAGTTIYNAEEFKEQLRIIKLAEDEINLSYIIGRVKMQNETHPLDIGDFSKKIRLLLRNTDFIGCDEDGNYYVVLMQANRDNLDIIQNRFNNAGIEFKVEESL